LSRLGLANVVGPRTILDRACGTGGVLTCALEHIGKNDVRTPDQKVLSARGQYPLVQVER
jgi:type I restriction-modification system DNA methylase subunit